MPTNQFGNNMETLNNPIVMWKKIHIVYKNYAKYNFMAYYWQKRNCRPYVCFSVLCTALYLDLSAGGSSGSEVGRPLSENTQPMA